MTGAADNPFRSFWMGGYEGADHLNGFGMPLDMAARSGHVDQLEADHARAAALGIRTVRESIGWRLAETDCGRFDLDRALRIADSAERHGLQVLWTLMHYGTPADVSLLDDAAIDRFAVFAAQVALTLGRSTDQAPIYNLINEISFLAWAVAHTGLIHPYRNAEAGAGDTADAGYDIKRRLVRMALAGVAAVRMVDPRARFLHVEPLVHVVPPRGRPELAAFAEQISAYQWQAWDMLSGHLEPELGGDLRALDLVGINHYHNSQWEAATEERLWWHLRDSRRRPFSELLKTVAQRYHRPMMVAETSHFGEGRAQWLNELASEVGRARAAGVPVHGVCLYPLIDRPDWEDPSRWHHSGLWDVEATSRPAEPPLRRVLCADYAAALQRWQAVLPEPAVPPVARPLLVVFSHLRWAFVHHRPQQMMSRLAGHFHILFVEEPLALQADGEPARLDCICYGPDIDVLLPRTPRDDPSFSDAQLAVIGPLLADFLARRPGGDSCTAWFYTPMAEPLRAWLPAGAVVYDCIDEMSAFLEAPPALPAREAALLAAADLVIASGPALWRARSPLAPGRVQLVANGVAASDHLPSVRDAASADASEARRLQGPHDGPRLGYAGVVDERLDLALIEALALAHPEWQIVIAGPIVKIDPAGLPRPANILWLGRQPYARLPDLMASWSVCLIPFVDNRITRFANPTKALEYLAAGKPVVSTAIPDLVELYDDAVDAVVGHAAFIAACERALREGPAQRAARQERNARLVGACAWDARVAQVAGLLAQIGAWPAARDAGS